ncbi:hypothetical protein BO83DRAFT_407352 [Aspergillus eucalypticola CBS 122712]|uniref:NAD(P)-binding protein n=1 Tax=Aspergillus eucalypticola (strain CBS 122712 / IBT 29274) TaxID=1448314 RepID=A0A317VQM6_ASPEC|nr:uncharacterized protein BO83DRAFT_407352 [Aspergillus eucalypticola CBS 122712]PWY75591.1 hypothetical protein BO83DRAFT_407352 [Aspergillus eucalypticola CBS 122712]
MESRTLLITGASGYIGCSVLSAILRTKETWAANLKVSALVRSESQATKVRELGVSPKLFSSFDELDRLEEVGEGFDIIIHAGAGWHTPSAKALIRGQGVRRQTTNADWTTDIAVIEEGEASGMTTYIVMAPTMFGLGSGPFNRFSMQLPTMIADALRTGSCSVVFEGYTVWNHHIFRGIKIPSGRKGIYFCETGEHSHLEFSEYLAKAGHYEVVKITIQEAGEKWVFGNTSSAELGFASNSRTKAVLESTFSVELTEILRILTVDERSLSI